MRTVEVNVHPEETVVVLGVSQRIKGYVGEHERAFGVVGNRKKLFSPDAIGWNSRLENLSPEAIAGRRSDPKPLSAARVQSRPKPLRGGARRQP